MRFEECVATCAEDYIHQAVRLATDRDFRHEISNRLFAASEAIFADDSVVREHERIFTELLQARSR
jgi:predicted O-linked N-acetylglucosamine transferase (SPINDLY family)